VGDDDKSISLWSRILSQAEAALAPGNTATQTKAVPPSNPSPPPPVDVITLILIDRRQLVSDKLRNALKSRLERDLNALGVVKQEPDVLKTQGLRLGIRWESKKPNANQQASYGKWDFPLYFEKGHTSDNLTASEVIDTMLAHGIRRLGRAKTQYEQAESGWNDKSVEGLGIQPLQGYRKLGFLKIDQVSARANDIETAYVNVVKHEFGHMCNRTAHTSGLLDRSVPISDPKATFTEEDQRAILREMVRLKNQSEAQMQRVYEQQNV
jgi:hypothetical protein